MAATAGLQMNPQALQRGAPPPAAVVPVRRFRGENFYCLGFTPLSLSPAGDNRRAPPRRQNFAVRMKRIRCAIPAAVDRAGLRGHAREGAVPARTPDFVSGWCSPYFVESLEDSGPIGELAPVGAGVGAGCIGFDAPGPPGELGGADCGEDGDEVEDFEPSASCPQALSSNSTAAITAEYFIAVSLVSVSPGRLRGSRRRPSCVHDGGRRLAGSGPSRRKGRGSAAV